MENASKALIMAGSILLSLMVISTVALMYNKISDAEQAKVNSEEAGKLTDYSLKFEKYNRTIYGSELMSLANLQEDYRNTQAEMRGYDPVRIEVEIRRNIIQKESSYFKKEDTEVIEDIANDKNILENEIREYEEPKSEYGNRSVKYFAQMSNREIAHKLKIPVSSSDDESDIEAKLKDDSKTEELMRLIDDYKDLKSIYTEFKNKRFKCTQIGYGQTGRVNLLRYTEI